jgi:hypothetical protein
MKTLAFITGLRHPDTVPDYDGAYADRVAASLEAWMRQTCGDFEIVATVNRMPENGRFKALLDTGKVAFWVVGGDPPKDRSRKQTLTDKAAKLAFATHRAAESSRLCMVADCDDFISPLLVEWLSERAVKGALFTIHRGYCLLADTGAVYRVDSFHRRCGTVNIWCSQTVEPRLKVCPHASLEEVRRTVPKSWRIFLARHSIPRRVWRKWTGNAPLLIPWRAAVYHLGHGDNISLNRGARLSRRHNSRMRENLGAQIDVSQAWLDSFGIPRVAREGLAKPW